MADEQNPSENQKRDIAYKIYKGRTQGGDAESDWRAAGEVLDDRGKRQSNTFGGWLNEVRGNYLAPLLSLSIISGLIPIIDQLAVSYAWSVAHFLEDWLATLVMAVQAIAIFFMTFFAFDNTRRSKILERLEKFEQEPDRKDKKRALLRAFRATTQFTGCWKFLWLSWLALYLLFSVEEALHVRHPDFYIGKTASPTRTILVDWATRSGSWAAAAKDVSEKSTDLGQALDELDATLARPPMVDGLIDWKTNHSTSQFQDIVADWRGARTQNDLRFPVMEKGLDDLCSRNPTIRDAWRAF